MAYNVKFLKGTAAAYAALTTKDANSFYYTSDDSQLYLGTIKLSNGADLADALTKISDNAADIDQLQKDLQALTGSSTGSVADQIKNAVDAAKQELGEDISANTTAIAAINNTDTGILAKAKEYADGKDTAIAAAKKAGDDAQSDVDALETKVGTVPEGKTVVQMISDAQTAATYDDTALSGRVTANKNAIDILNGEGDGSVKKKVDTAINDFATKISDDGSINTFKELVDYVGTHGPEAAQMTADIAQNKTDISNLKTKVGDIPAGATATTVVGYIDEKVAAADQSGAIATAKQEAINTAAADATTKANTARDEAKTYADGLANNYATAAQGEKADSAVQTIATGTDNGTIKVDGTDVPVKGLGGAAYANTNAFDPAGSADTALNTAKTYTESLLTWGTIA